MIECSGFEQIIILFSQKLDSFEWLAFLKDLVGRIRCGSRTEKQLSSANCFFTCCERKQPIRDGSASQFNLIGEAEEETFL